MDDTQSTNQQNLLQQINPSGSNLSELAKESALRLEEEKEIIEKVKETAKLMSTPMPALPDAQASAAIPTPQAAQPLPAVPQVPTEAPVPAAIVQPDTTVTS
ncbi:MAG TPA: hypothetical protein VEW42_05425 [Candidatus Eisenbacteria bacterium]|nr:hypothetical protein [Candidatus Eisenbacteria bacterium]